MIVDSIINEVDDKTH